MVIISEINMQVDESTRERLLRGCESIAINWSPTAKVPLRYATDPTFIFDIIIGSSAFGPLCLLPVFIQQFNNRPSICIYFL